MLKVSTINQWLAHPGFRTLALGRNNFGFGFVRGLASVAPEIAQMADEMTSWRRDFHQHPEIAFEEVRTSGIVEEKLRGFGNIRIDRVSATGVIGLLEGTSTEKVAKRIGLRADIDALAMEELNEFEHKSKNPGKFHGCGHDGHTSMLLGTAKYLAANRHLFSGSVAFIFQPAEESRGGGKLMVEEGLFEKFPCDAIYALHNWPLIEKGTIAVHKGPVMASEDDFDIVIDGKGGHAAMPHLTVDPIVVGSHVVSALQSVVSRNSNPVFPVVVSVTSFQAGSAYNVIPSSAVMKGTIRSFSQEERQKTGKQVEELVQTISASFGASATVYIKEGYPATINTDEHVHLAREAIADVVGKDNVLTEKEVPPSMGSEDFSYMLGEVPGCYFWLGSDSKEMVHHPQYDFDDTIMPLGVQAFVNIVTR